MQVAVIGLGIFGRHVALALYQAGHDVLAIDRQINLVNKVKNRVTQAVVADASDKQALHDLGLGLVDAAVVSLGDNMAGSILVTMFLKEIDVERIIVKAVSDDHKAVLDKVGATDVIFPERDMALKVADSVMAQNVVDWLPLTEDFAIVELKVPESFAGRTLAELELRKKYGVQVIAIKQPDTDQVNLVISPDEEIKLTDVLVVIGRNDDIKKLKEAK
ncbi:MAG: TrkA family potassium uptake protein [Proteobacteria bacterium]|nr:TrkA family potassium uptake protein [Pseudomonadota bacterium]